MTPLTTNKQRTTGLGLFLLFLLLSVILAIFLTYPKFNDWRQEQQEIKSSSSNLATINGEVATAEQEMSQMNNTGFQKADTAIPSAPSLGDLYAMIENLAGSSNVHLASVQAVPQGSYTAASQALNNSSSSGSTTVTGPIPAFQPPTGLGVTSLSIEVSGNYASVQQFLSNLYSSLRLIDVQTLTLTGITGTSAQNGTPNTLNITDPTIGTTIQAFTYYLQ